MRKRLSFFLFKRRRDNETNILCILLLRREKELVKSRKIVRRVFPTLYT